MFPAELHKTIDGLDGNRPVRRRNGPKILGLSSITAVKTADDLFRPDGEDFFDEANHANGAAPDLNKVAKMIDALENGDEDIDGFLSGDDEEWDQRGVAYDEDGNMVEDAEDQFTSDEEDDYNGEKYFDVGEGDDMDDDRGDDGAEF
jgi:DNA-directed RNA polymerase III subunit RPC7